MDDIGLLEFQFSQARVGGRSQAGSSLKSAGRSSESGHSQSAHDEQLTELIDRCKTILLPEIPHAFMDTFQEELCYDQGELADRLESLPGLVVITRRGGDKKVVKVEFLAYLLATKGFYDTFGHRQDNWPWKERKIRTNLEQKLADASSSHLVIKQWRTTAPPCLWDSFSSFWIRDNCITWLNDGANWKPREVKAVLQNHQDILEGFLGQPPLQKAVEKPAPPVWPGKSTKSNTKKGSTSNQLVLVDNESMLSSVASEHYIFSQSMSTGEQSMSTSEGCINAAVNFRMHDGRIAMIEVVTDGPCFLIDCNKISIESTCRYLSEFFANDQVIKLFHNLFQPAIAILRDGGVSTIRGCMDSQLALECTTGDIFGSLNDMLKHFSALCKVGNDNSNGTSAKKNVKAPPGFQHYPQSISRPALLLWKSREHLLSKLADTFDVIQRASEKRANMKSRKLVFDKRKNYALASRELLYAIRPETDIFEPSPLVVNSDIDELLYLLPTRIREAIEGIGTENLTEVILDKGRTPSAWIGGKRYFLEGVDKSSVDQSEIDCVTGGLGYFGSDNRAGIERQLHRVSCMRNRSGNIIGLTLRVGRNIDGISDMVCDLLLGSKGSILFLGEPASGKTTIVREAARLLSEEDTNVCIIDTSNEIAGDGDIPHPCVGHARRMMVPSLDQQASVMIECVQNHAPSIMVIDEIGRPTEVEAARTCKQRGVRMVASAHGDLRKLARNPKLKGLIGGVETVTLGDTAAKSEAKGKGFSGMHKLKSQRAGTPVFDIIVEVNRNSHHEWFVVEDTAKAVDAILEGAQYEVQRRVRCPSDGSFQVLREKR